MKTKEINLNFAETLKEFTKVSSYVPSPYLIPVKIFVSTDELSSSLNIEILYFNKEAEESISIDGVMFYAGKLTGKIQSIVVTNYDKVDLEAIIKKSSIKNKDLLLLIYKKYIEPQI